MSRYLPKNKPHLRKELSRKMKLLLIGISTAALCIVIALVITGSRQKESTDLGSGVDNTSLGQALNEGFSWQADKVVYTDPDIVLSTHSVTLTCNLGKSRLDAVKLIESTGAQGAALAKECFKDDSITSVTYITRIETESGVTATVATIGFDRSIDEDLDIELISASKAQDAYAPWKLATSYTIDSLVYDKWGHPEFDQVKRADR